MSADLLRRAAAKLREAAAAALTDPGERWMVDQSPDDGLVLASYMPDDVQDDGSVSTSCIAYFAYPGDEDARAHVTALGVATFAALMHPPVALAVAELLDHIADDVSDAGDHIEPGGLVRDEYGSIRFDWTAAVKLARAILREEES
jgi:hypothetical protein